MKDISNTDDVKTMVDRFYERVNNDALLSPVFNDFANVDWLHHLPKMYQFWNFLILGIPGYKGQPFPAHAVLPIRKEHFEKWLQLFKENIDAHFHGANAELAKAKAENIATVFQYRLGLLDGGNAG